MPRPNKKTRTFEMEVTVVGIDANHEEVTKAAYDYRQAHVYPYVLEKGYTLVRLQGQLAYRVYVVAEVVKPAVDYLTGVGHGNYDVYTGQYNNPLFQVGHYAPAEAMGKIVHFLSCETAARLGPDFVKNGCRAYFGYDENFTFVMAHANIFFECDSEIDRAFCDGLTAAQVHERVIGLYNKRITELRQAGSLYVAATLEYDRDHLRNPVTGAQWGDPNAKLE